MGDEELSQKISQEVTENLATLLETHKDEISETIKRILMDLINHKSKEANAIDANAILKELIKRCVHII